MNTTEQWVTENVNHLFDYAMGYIANTGIIPTPKFHMVDAYGRVAVMSCDFWDIDDEDRDFEQFGSSLDRFAESFGAVVCLLMFVGTIDGEDVIGILTHKAVSPKLFYKPIIWSAGIVDFGPLTVVPANRVKNLRF
jgi:hypothetical protein